MNKELIASMRGEQVTIGATKAPKPFTFQFPVDLPQSDEEIIAAEELIASIDLALSPFRMVIEVGESVQKSLRNDITEAMEARKKEEMSGECQRQLFAIDKKK